jgi:ubiquitin carboxyl-terminal hydrolase L3
MSAPRRVIPLPNEPGELFRYAVKLGVDASSVAFAEVFSFEEEWLAYVPQPIHSLMFLFPVGPPGGVIEQRHRAIAELPSPQPWFTKQTIANGCATIAVIHAVMNNAGVARLREGSWFAAFAARAAALTPDERAALIDDDAALDAAHAEAAAASTVPLPEHCTTHYATFVRVGGRLWELDGRKPQPICHGDAADLLRAALAVVRRDFVPHLEDPMQISMVALVGAGAA